MKLFTFKTRHKAILAKSHFPFHNAEALGLFNFNEKCGWLRDTTYPHEKEDSASCF